jgi:hypothetical protein
MWSEALDELEYIFFFGRFCKANAEHRLMPPTSRFVAKGMVASITPKRTEDRCSS